MQSVHEIIRLAEQNYLQGNTKLGEYVTWSMHDTIEKIDAYLNSKHISGETDSLGREKPFFNIASAAVNIWYRATDLDRKDIRFIPTKASSVVLAFIANVLLQNWMNKYRFGAFLNQWGRSLARYGSSVAKFVVKDGELVPSIVPWNRFIADPVQFDALPRIEKFYLTPAQLRRIPEYDQDQVDHLIKTRATRKTLDGAQKDNMDDFVELYEVHGLMDSRLLDKEPDLGIEDKEIKYTQQMHVVSYVQEGQDYRDFTLYRGKEGKDPYMITHLIEEDGRTLAIGAVEYLFDAQWMVNHSVKNQKDTLDIASKLIFQTADSHFVGKNVLSAIETGDIFVHAVDKPLTRVANDKPDISALQNFSMMWQQLGQEITATPDSMRGITPPSSTPYSTTALLTGQSNSLFEIMTENKGLSLEEIVRTYVIPHLKKQLKNKDEIVGILDDAGIEEIDALYVPAEAVRRFNDRTIEAIFDGNADALQPFDAQNEEQTVKEDMGAMGNKRFFVPDELSEKQWDEVFADFEWDSIRVEVTNEQADKQAVIQTLATLYTAMLPIDPVKANIILAKIMTETGVFSPMQLGSMQAKPSPIVPPGGGAQAITSLTDTNNVGTTAGIS